MRSTGSTGSTGKGNTERKGSEGKEGEGRGMLGLGKYARGGTWGGHTQQNFGRGSAGQNGKHGKLKEVREEKKVRECGTRYKQNNNRWRRNKKESKSS